MKRDPTRKQTVRWSIATFLLACAGPSGLATGWQLDWWTLEPGGGRTLGSGYELTATLGQPVAGPATAGAYRLDAGFWPGRLLPVPSDGQLQLEWPASIGPVVVETQRELAPAGIWEVVGLTPAPVGNRMRVVLPVTDQNGFFRLRLP